MKSDKNSFKKKFEVITFPIAYLQMLVQSVLYKIYSK